MASLHILSDHKATYTDTDGDLVTVTNTVGKLTAGLFTGVASGSGDQWQTLDLSGGGFDLSALTVTVVKAGGGDGFTSLGYLNSTGHPLGAVTIKGDLGRIDAGAEADAETAPAVASLTLQTMAKSGLATQDQNGALSGTLHGALGKLSVAGDMQGSLTVEHQIGSVYIGGSLKGTNLDHSGYLACVDTTNARGSIGNVTILGSILGSSGPSSGSLSASGKSGAVVIGHDLLGGSAAASGLLFFGTKNDPNTGDFTSLTIKGTVHGGSVSNSGNLTVVGNGGAVTIGAITGGAATNTGVATFQQGTGAVVIGGDVTGGTAASSGNLSLSIATSVTVKGSLIGTLGSPAASTCSRRRRLRSRTTCTAERRAIQAN